MSAFFQSPAADSNLILNTAVQMLEAFRQVDAKAVDEALVSIRDGLPVEQAGRIMLNAIQSSINQPLQETQEKLKTVQDTADDLRSLRDEQEKQLSKLEKDLERLQREYEYVSDQANEFEETISIQNRLLARQHRKLQDLLGNMQEEDE